MRARAVARAEALAAVRVAAVIAQLVETAAARLPGDVRAEAGAAGELVLIGRGLLRRMAFDARLRDFGRVDG
ncbi:hypothetical protein [Aquisediminimonas sediminicola]|uniref:hypothetical protein n=1 Tax=Alteraquisediminimonas sediminicola TaxID=2676787 RepID=UPI001C8F1270|nr:hypothetical protein [Aquisediminimonas sediminicola]